MAKKTTSIPVSPMADEFGAGIAVERISIKKVLPVDKLPVNTFEGAKQSHRHDGHSFFLLEHGTVFIEIDFKKYKIKPRSVIYIHPNQVHNTMALENIVVSSWSINNENLHPAYLKLLEEIAPAKPLLLNKEIFSLISDAVSICIRFAERKNDKLYHSLLKDSCNALVALVASQYVEKSASTRKISRFEMIAKAFTKNLEQHYASVKRPAAYAQQLNISTPYLNECVKNTTGHSVSHQIQQRIILEAKRFLYHSDKSVKEIALELGYEDYPYFSRLFTKATSMTPLTFRNKNRD